VQNLLNACLSQQGKTQVVFSLLCCIAHIFLTKPSCAYLHRLATTLSPKKQLSFSAILVQILPKIRHIKNAAWQEKPHKIALRNKISVVPFVYSVF
jgi:hypothetical protein